MSNAPLKVLRLSDLIDARPGFRLQTRAGSLSAHDCTAMTIFGASARELAGKSILLATTTVAASARAMIALDGLVARLVITPPDLDPVRIASILDQAGVDAIVSDSPGRNFGSDKPLHICDNTPANAAVIDIAPTITQWVLPTSGTSGPPKLVLHHLQGLLGAITAASEKPAPIWATFYDIRRFGGLQILLRACATGAHLVLTEADESLSDYLERCARAGVSHFSGTPSHWRRLLLHPDADRKSVV
jgi:acyl-coenzyme A synthetase/AMP-(fatty) acid ligase